MFAGNGKVRCAWRAGCRQFTRRRKACHSIFVSFDVRRLFAAVDRKLCRQLLLSLCRRCVPAERANPLLCNAQNHRWPGTSLFRFERGECQDMRWILGGGRARRDLARCGLSRVQENKLHTERASAWALFTLMTLGGRNHDSGHENAALCRNAVSCGTGPPRGACRPGDGTSCGASKKLLVGTSDVFFVIVGGAV